MDKVEIVSKVVNKREPGAYEKRILHGISEGVDVSKIIAEVLLEVAKEYLSRIAGGSVSGDVDFVNGLSIASKRIVEVIDSKAALGAFTDEQLITAKKVQSMLDELSRKYLRKDAEDTAEKIITFLEGLKAGEFVPGMIGGHGAQIDKDGNAEMESLTLRSSLVVPKITFNCVDVISGDKANTFAFGTIKAVDVASQMATLDLLDGQLGTLHVDDICRGVFHNIADPNDKDDTEDNNGFYKYSGFSTSYFSPTEIIVNEAGEMKFRYILQGGTTNHPRAGMNFFAYGNFTDTSRQAMTYETRYYTRRLKDMNTWAIVPGRNISMQSGLVEGLNIGGFVMHGYGVYQENNYFTGTTIQFTTEQKNELMPIVLSMTNDNSSVECDSSGKVLHVDKDENILAGYQPKTIVSMYQGNTKLMLESIFLATPSGNVRAYSSHNSDKNEYTVAVSGLTSDALDREALEITLYANVGGEQVSRKGVLYINKTRNGGRGHSGQNGKYFQDVYMLSNAKPNKPSAGYQLPGGWSTNVPGISIQEVQYRTSGSWDVVNSFLRSPKISASGFTKERISFNFTQDTYVEIEMTAHSEANYDVGYIGKLDASYSSKPSESSVLGRTSGDSVTVRSYVMVPSGSHYVEVMYAKDGSGDRYGDYIDVRVMGLRRIWKSSSEVTYDNNAEAWHYNGWSEPALYNVESGEERIYILTDFKKSLPVPFSDPDIDGFLPMITCDKYDSNFDYAPGERTSINGKFYESIKYNETGIAPPNVEYWKEIQSWTRTPRDVDEVNRCQYICVRRKTNSFWGSWSEPSLFNSVGEKGPDGAMPRNRGKFKQGEKYIYGKEGNTEYRDYVIFGEAPNEMVYQVRYRNSEVTTAPTPGLTDENWEMANKFSFVAMNTALIEGADIGGLLFKNQKIVSQDGESIIIDGVTGTITAKKANITGVINSKEGKIGGFNIGETFIKNGNLKLFDKGLLFMRNSSRIGIGDCFPPSTGIVGLVGMDVVLNIEDRTHAGSLAAISIEVTGGGTPLGTDARQRGIRVVTSGGSRDYALDLKGKIKMRDASHPNGMDGITQIVGVQAWNGNRYRPANLMYINGILVNVLFN